MVGLPAAEQVLVGWQRAAGRRAEQVAYWDLVAALSTLADMAFCVPALHDQGRSDLDADHLGQRRNAFLSTALSRLDDDQQSAHHRRTQIGQQQHANEVGSNQSANAASATTGGATTRCRLIL